MSNRTESSEHLPPREHESAAGENAALLTLFDSDEKGGGRGEMCLEEGGTSRTEQSAYGWGGSARQRGSVYTAEMGDERRRQKGINMQ